MSRARWMILVWLWFWAPAVWGQGRDRAHYTADRPADFLHMRLALEFTEEGMRERTCLGRVTYTVRPRGQALSRLSLNAVDLEVMSARVGGREATFSGDDELLEIRLPVLLALGEEVEVEVEYRLEDPEKGMYFVLPGVSVPDKPLMVYTMSEPLEARYWVPTHDWPNERWTSDIEITVPANYTAVANGVLVRRVEGGGRATFHWRSEVPTDPHMMGMVLGELVELRDEWKGKPVTVYTQPGLESAARHTFRRVPEMMEFYSGVIGVDFPYPGYSHITVVEHHHGGMEHAGFSFVRPAYIAVSDDGEWWMERTQTHYLAHMLGHMWFGGVVNYRSVSEAWLNEGFASHLHELWLSHTDADPSARLAYDFWRMARKIARFDSSEKGTPLVDRELGELGDIYTNDGGKLYDKGSWVVHMLRQSMGDELFWGAVRNYLEEHRWGSVGTFDLVRALEEASGRDLEQFFRQWVYGRGIPRLEVSYRWNSRRGRVSVEVKQAQAVNERTPAFTFPLELSFVVGGAEVRKEVSVREGVERFTFELESEPSQFWVDGRGRILKVVEVDMPLAMKLEQARHAGTVTSRLMGVESLKGHSRRAVIRVLRDAVKDEGEFWGVRVAAAEVLGDLQVRRAEKALLGMAGEVEGRPEILAAVVRALGSYSGSEEAQERVLQFADPGQPLVVEQGAVSVLGRTRVAGDLRRRIVEELERAAGKPTRRWVRLAALKSLGRLGGAESLERVLELTRGGAGDELRNEAILAVGKLGGGEARERVRGVLVELLSDPDRGAQMAAIGALGDLGDAEAIPILERIGAGGRGYLRKAAGLAIRQIRVEE